MPVHDRTGYDDKEPTYIRMPDSGIIIRLSVWKSAVALETQTGKVFPLLCPVCRQRGFLRTWDYFVWTADSRLEGLCGHCGNNFEYDYRRNDKRDEN